MRERELSDSEQSIYRSMNWLVQHTRPDLAVGVSLASKKLQGAKTGGRRKMIKLVERSKNRVVEVEMWRLEREGVQMEVFSDALLKPLK